MANPSTSSNNNNHQRPTRACTVNTKASGQKDDHLDHSVLTEPLNLGQKNVAQIAFVLSNGTAEVKDLLLNECNIIYECRVCTNLFRSFGNYVAHKRIYCKEHKCDQMLLYDPAWHTVPLNDETIDGVTSPELDMDSGSSNDNDSIEQDVVMRHQVNSIIRSPSKTLNLKRPSSVANKSLREEQNNKRKRKSLVSIVHGLTKPPNDSAENGISISSTISKRNTTNYDNNSSTTFSSNQPKNNSEFIPQSSRRTSKKILSRPRPKLKNFKAVHEQLTALVNQKLASSNGPKVATIDVPLLTPEHLNRLYFCGNFVFRCPHCIKDFSFFASAIRHMMKLHKYTRLKAKWVSYLHSRMSEEAVNDEEETKVNDVVKEPDESNQEDQSSEHTPHQDEINPKVSSLKIVRVNEHYQAIPAGSENATKSQGESSSTKPISDIKMSVDDDVNTLTFSDASSMINGVEGLNESQQNPTDNGNSTNSMTICINPVVVRKTKRKKNLYTVPKSESRNTQNSCRFYHEIKPKIAKTIDEHRAEHGNSVPLPDHIFTPLYNCRGFMFKCPDCEALPVLCFANAVRHVSFEHVKNKDNAKLFVFQYSKTVKKGAKSIVPLAQPTNGHYKTPVTKSSRAIVSQLPQNGSSITTNGKSFNSNFNTTSFPINSISANLAITPTASTSAATSATDNTVTATHKICTKKKKHHITNGHKHHHNHPNHNDFNLQQNYAFNGRPSSSSLSAEVITIDSGDEDEAIFKIKNETTLQPNLNANDIEIKSECKIPTNSLVMIYPIKMICSPEEFDAALATHKLKHDIVLEIEPSVNDSILQNIKSDDLSCLECPQLRIPNFNILRLHVVVTHSQAMVLLCNVCNRYATTQLVNIQAHLFREHGVINEDNYHSLIAQKCRSSKEEPLATQSQASNSLASSITSPPKSCAKVNGHTPTLNPMNGASLNGVNHQRFQLHHPTFTNSATSSPSSNIHNRPQMEHFSSISTPTMTKNNEWQQK